MSVETAELNPGFSCEEFYKALYAGAEGYIALCTRHPRCKKLYVNGFFSADEIEKLILQAKQLSGRYHVYHSVCTLKEVQKRGRGKKENYIGAMFFAVDVDAKDFIPDPQERERAKREKDDYQWDKGLLEECKASAYKRITSFQFYPSAIIDSGHGYYGIYLLKEFWKFESEEELRRFEDINSRLHRFLGGDSTFDAARLLRVAGTINVKPGCPMPSEILKCNLELRYNPGEFDDALPPLAEIRTSRRPVAVITTTQKAEAVDIDRLPLPKEIRRAITTGEKGDRPSRSERDQAIAYHLVANGLTDQQIIQVFEEHACGDKYRTEGENSDNYISRTIEKAHKLVEAKPRLRVPPELPSGALELNQTIVITDDENAAAEACRNGIPCVAVTGLRSCSPGGLCQEGQGITRFLLDELGKIKTDNRGFVLALASDVGKSHRAYQCYSWLIEQLYARGASFMKMVILPQITENRATRLDDYLTKNSAEAFWELVDGTPVWVPSRGGAKVWAWARINKAVEEMRSKGSPDPAYTEETLEALAALKLFSELEYARAKDSLCSVVAISKRALDSSVKKKVSEIEARQRPDTSEGGDLVRDVLPDAPVPPETRVPPGWELGPDGIWMDSEDSPVRVTSTPVVVIERMVELSSSVEWLKLAYVRDAVWKEQVAMRGMLSDWRQVVRLADYGFPVTTGNAKEIIRYIREFEDKNLAHLKVSYTTHHLGWQGENGEYGFLWGPRTIGDKDIAFRGIDAGDEQIARSCKEKGTLEGWLEAINKIAEFPQAMIGLYASFASPLLPILGCPNFIIDWCGPSSLGKTTVLMIAAGVWGNPDLSAADSFLRSWDITQVAIERSAAVLRNMPLILDDTKRAKSNEIVAKTLYQFASGCGRGRGTKGGLSETVTWNSILLSTGEAPATSFTKDQGTYGRTLELWGSPFCGADKKALVDEIKCAIITNYGHAGPKFIEWVIEHRQDWPKWKAEYQELVSEYSKKLTESPVMGRLATYLAAIAIAGKLAHEAIPFAWQYYDPVMLVMDKIREEARAEDKAKEALERVVAWAYGHEESFYGRHQVITSYGGEPEARVPSGGWSGRWDPGNNWSFIGFYPHVLRRALSECGFPGEAEYEGIVKTWRDRGWLDADPTKKELANPTWTAAEGKSLRMVKIRRKAIESVGMA